MAMSASSKVRFNLQNASILLLDENTLSMRTLVQILSGFGATKMVRCNDQASAEVEVVKTIFDLIIVDATGPSLAGFNFVKWLRRSGIEPNCHTPVLLTSGHTAQNSVKEARDCGAHFIIAKPMTPTVVLERIIWISKEGRKFLETDTYVGPDRRFKNNGPPRNTEGRRKDDQTKMAEDASVPEMEQDMSENEVMTPRVAL